MKKIYLGALTLALCSASIAQNVSNRTAIETKVGGEGTSTSVRPNLTDDNRAITVLWSDDCSNAANWSFTNTSTPALDWYVETNTDLDAITPTALTASLSPFASATASNGFLVINSDNAGSGVTVIAEARITVPQADLAGESDVKLRFSHAYRWWNDTRGVRVSNDNGVSWTEFLITDAAGYDLGYSSGEQDTENPQIESIDISSVAGNPTGDILIEFFYNDNADWGWLWAVDDVEVIRTPDYDLVTDVNYFGSIGTEWLAYHLVPTAQIADIEFSSIVTNDGLLDQTNTGLAVSVNSGATLLASAPMTSVAGATDSLFTTANYTPAALGTYTFDITVASADFTDDAPANNTIESKSIEVTDYTYGRDNGTETGAITNVSSNTGLSMSIGNVMNVFADGVVGALDIKISDDAANAGKVMYAAVYILNAAGDAYDWAGQSADYTIAAGDVDGFVKLVLESPVDVTAGQELLIVAGHYGDDVGFSYAQTAELETVLGFTDDGASLFNLTGASVMMIRADMRDFTGVNELEVVSMSLGQNFPNPSNGTTTINYSLENAENVSIEITDVTGRVVEVMTLGTVAAGNHSVEVNTAQLGAGTYFYTLSNGTTKITKTMTVK